MCGTCGDAGLAERAAFDIQLHTAERRTGRESDDINRRGGRKAQLTECRLQHTTFRAARNEARRVLGRDARGHGIEMRTQLIGIVGLDNANDAFTEAESSNDRS